MFVRCDPDERGVLEHRAHGRWLVELVVAQTAERGGPDDGCTSPSSARNVVLFPAPFGREPLTHRARCEREVIDGGDGPNAGETRISRRQARALGFPTGGTSQYACGAVISSSGW